MIGDAIPAARADQAVAAGRSRSASRWLSGRALLLHAAVVTVVAGCVAAAWWQATRALAGNGLSWFYTVEWPAFAVIAVWGWWHLIHEDPEAYRARRQRSADGPGTAPEGGAAAAGDATAAKVPTVERGAARLAHLLAALVVTDSALGVACVVLVPFGRPSGLLPARMAVVYPLHAAMGLVLLAGATVLLNRVRASSRLARLTGWLGGLGTATAGAGGLLTASHPLRFAGMAVMLLGAVLAGFGYTIPAIERLT